MRGAFRSKSSREAEILALRHQLNVLRRVSPRRPVFSNFDRVIFGFGVGVYGYRAGFRVSAPRCLSLPMTSS
jgi:hypothetical protein